MTARVQRRARTPDIIAPDDILTEPSKPVWVPTGKRKQVPAIPVSTRRLDWPSSPTERYELLDLWFYLAPQIAGRLPTLLALRKWINRDNGTAWATDETLARWSGCISVSKAGKDISRLVSCGLFITKHSFEADRSGKLRKRRTLILALPNPLPTGTKTPPNWDEVARDDENHVAPRVRDELSSGRGRTRKTYRTRSPKTYRTTCDDITGVSLDNSSSDKSASNEDNLYRRAKAIDVEPDVGGPGACSVVSAQSPCAAHDRTAGLQGPASAEHADPSQRRTP